jgi:predicted small lipoprotein YifL
LTLRTALGALFVLMALPACGPEKPLVFPDGLTPLDEVNEAPAPGNENHFPEEIVTVSGITPEYGWVHARAFVHAPLAATWAAMHDPDVSVDRRAVSEWTIEHDVETGYDFSYRVHNIVHDLITIDFDITWRHGVVQGSPSAPTVVAARYQKTAGSSVISLLTGSVIARRVDDRITAIEFIEHLRALATGPDIAERFIRDYYASIVARVHGRPLPTYE